MITGELKNKIDALWEIFWTGGLTNPLDVIEQITYLMFIHDLDESDDRSAKVSLSSRKSLRGNISKAFCRRVEWPIWMSEG